MTARNVLVLLLTCWPCVANAQQTEQVPARIDEQGRLVYWTASKSPVEYVPPAASTPPLVHTVPLENVRFLTMAGEEVTPEAAKNRLASWTPVLIGCNPPFRILGPKEKESLRATDLDKEAESFNRNVRVNQFYKSYFKPDTLLVVIRWEDAIGGEALDREMPLPPTCMHVTLSESNAIDLPYPVLKPVWETRTREITPGQHTTYKVCKFVPERRVKTVDIDHYEVFDTKGNKLSLDQYQKLLTEPRPVLVSADGKPVHSLFLHNIKDDVLVIVVRQEAAPAPEHASSPNDTAMKSPREAKDYPRDDSPGIEGTWIHADEQGKSLVLRASRNAKGELKFDYLFQHFSYRPVFQSLAEDKETFDIRYRLVPYYDPEGQTEHTLRYQVKWVDGRLKGQFSPSWQKPYDVELRKVIYDGPTR